MLNKIANQNYTIVVLLTHVQKKFINSIGKVVFLSQKYYIFPIMVFLNHYYENLMTFDFLLRSSGTVAGII